MDHKNEIIADPQFKEIWNSTLINFVTKEFESGFSSDKISRGIGPFCTNAVSMVDCNGTPFPFSLTVASAIAGSLFTQETWW